MKAKEMLEIHIEEMECEIVGLEDQINTLTTKKETIKKQMYKLKEKMAAIPKDGD